MDDLIPANETAPMPPANPFAKLPAANAGALNVGAVAIETERAIAEAQGQLTLAKKFPRSVQAATAELIEACKQADFAKSAFYSVPNRGSGPSIRFAEEVARCYGNFQFGHRELSRLEGRNGELGRSEVEVYAWDMQNNNYSKRQITVLHVVDTKNGPKVLRDQTDIDNKIANVASKQMRGRILALLPKHMVAAGIAECKKTLAGGNEKPIAQRVTDMTGAFAKYGVTAAMLTKQLGHSLDDVTADELADLIGIYNAIKEGAKPSDYFGGEEAKEEGQDARKAALTAAITRPAETIGSGSGSGATSTVTAVAQGATSDAGGGGASTSGDGGGGGTAPATGTAKPVRTAKAAAAAEAKPQATAAAPTPIEAAAPAATDGAQGDDFF